VSQAKYSVVVVAPASEGLVAEERTVVMSSYSQLCNSALSVEADLRQVVPHLVSIVATLIHIVVAKLAKGVVTPALHSTIVQQCAGMEDT